MKKTEENMKTHENSLWKLTTTKEFISSCDTENWNLKLEKENLSESDGESKMRNGRAPFSNGHLGP